MGIILEKKVIKSKNVNNKKCAPKLILFESQIQAIFDTPLPLEKSTTLITI